MFAGRSRYRLWGNSVLLTAVNLRRQNKTEATEDILQPLFLCSRFFSPSFSILYLFLHFYLPLLFSLSIIRLGHSPFVTFLLFIHFFRLFLLCFRVFTQPWLQCHCVLWAFHMRKKSQIYWASPCRGVNLASLVPLTICCNDAAAGCSGGINSASLAPSQTQGKGFVYLHSSGHRVRRFPPNFDKNQSMWVWGLQ